MIVVVIFMVDRKLGEDGIWVWVRVFFFIFYVVLVFFVFLLINLGKRGFVIECFLIINDRSFL